LVRASFVALLALIPAGPAFAQDAGLLAREPWECRSVSLTGDPDADLSLDFAANGEATVTFGMRSLVEQDLVEVEFELTGPWSLSDAVITTNATQFTFLGASINGEPLEGALREVFAADLEEAMADFNGSNEIAYISDHAMVLTEPDASISCWR